MAVPQTKRVELHLVDGRRIPAQVAARSDVSVFTFDRPTARRTQSQEDWRDTLIGYNATGQELWRLGSRQITLD